MADELDIMPTDEDMPDVEEPLRHITIKRKGRGFHNDETERRRTEGVRAPISFESVKDDSKAASVGKAARSIEGWIVLVTGVHEECDEETIIDRFSEFGEIKNLHLNLDRRTGYAKGYALLEYERFSEAKEAIDNMNGTTMLDNTIECDLAFVKPPQARENGRRGFVRQRRGRSTSPDERR